MASTETALNAYTNADKICRKMVEQDDEAFVQVSICNNAARWFWMADAWRWSIGVLNNISLAANTQDYPYGSSLPTDYLYTHSAYHSDGQQFRDVKVTPDLPATSVIVGAPQMVTRLTGQNSFRIWPRTPTQLSSAQSLVQFYKKMAPAVTAGNINTTGALVFDDEWFPVYQEIVIWYMMRYCYDDRAGTVQYKDGERTVVGQLGLIDKMLDDMRARDALMPSLSTRTPGIEPPPKR
jgi:hypothetical protein